MGSFEADKRILGFSHHTLKAYALQLKILVREIGDLEIEEISLNLLKECLAKQSERLKPSSLGHRIRFVRFDPFFVFLLKKDILLEIHP